MAKTRIFSSSKKLNYSNRIMMARTTSVFKPVPNIIEINGKKGDR